MRLVLDTNILVSALISPLGPPGRLLAAVKRKRVTLVTSREQIAELRDVLGRERLRPYLRRDDAADLLATIAAVAEVAEQLPNVALSPDPDDDPILATAIAGGADLLVSGDRAGLLALEQVEAIETVTAAEAIRPADEARG